MNWMSLLGGLMGGGGGGGLGGLGGLLGGAGGGVGGLGGLSGLMGGGQAGSMPNIPAYVPTAYQAPAPAAPTGMQRFQRGLAGFAAGLQNPSYAAETMDRRDELARLNDFQRERDAYNRMHDVGMDSNQTRRMQEIERYRANEARAREGQGFLRDIAQSLVGEMLPTARAQRGQMGAQTDYYRSRAASELNPPARPDQAPLTPEVIRARGMGMKADPATIQAIIDMVAQSPTPITMGQLNEILPMNPYGNNPLIEGQLSQQEAQIQKLIQDNAIRQRAMEQMNQAGQARPSFLQRFLGTGRQAPQPNLRTNTPPPTIDLD